MDGSKELEGFGGFVGMVVAAEQVAVWRVRKVLKAPTRMPGGYGGASRTTIGEGCEIGMRKWTVRRTGSSGTESSEGVWWVVSGFVGSWNFLGKWRGRWLRKTLASVISKVPGPWFHQPNAIHKFDGPDFVL